MASETLIQWGKLAGQMGRRLIEAMEVRGNADWLRDTAKLDLAIEILRNQYVKIAEFGANAYPLSEKQVAVIENAIARADEYLDIEAKYIRIADIKPDRQFRFDVTGTTLTGSANLKVRAIVARQIREAA